MKRRGGLASLLERRARGALCCPSEPDSLYLFWTSECPTGSLELLLFALYSFCLKPWDLIQNSLWFGLPGIAPIPKSDLGINSTILVVLGGCRPARHGCRAASGSYLTREEGRLMKGSPKP